MLNMGKISAKQLEIKYMSIQKSIKPVLFTVLTLICCFSGPLLGQITVQRGPYLQKPTSTSMVVRWRTSLLTDSRVMYGSNPVSLSQNMDIAAAVNDHEVEITGLQPYTKYYYAVGTTGQMLAGGDSSHYFITAPTPGTVQPIRVWAIGDFGKDNAEQALVRDAYLNFEGDTHTDLWLWLGDNAYDNGSDTEYQNKVFANANGYSAMFPRLPFLPTPGNHDYLSIQNPLQNISPPNHSGPYYDIITVP
ncbi:MAG TPA: metallophosphoesterase family protein, partial [Bacteroidetes bacterium]|nr:metallophosphoesterase family protein [Bacteroidota bacterium]